MSRSINIVIADNQKLLLDTLQIALNQESGLVVKKSVTNISDALAAVQKGGIDLVISDVSLNDASGAQVVSKLKRTSSKTKVLLLTNGADSSVILKAVDGNIEGIQMKDCSLEELIQSIKIVSSGQKYYAPAVLKMIASRPPVESTAGLSNREVEIMQMLAEGLSARDIGERLSISARTVETHKANIMRKLNVKKATHLVKIAYDRGLVKAKGV